MNIHVSACVQGVHCQHTHMISDGQTSIDDVPLKVQNSLHQAFLQVGDVIIYCFIYAFLCNTTN